jgi:UDP-sulfoquinovose synthase
MRREERIEIGVEPLLPVPMLQSRVKRWRELGGRTVELFVGDIAHDHRFVYHLLERFVPDAIIHYAEQPSAPFSMMDRDKCLLTQINNLGGTLNVLFGTRHACPDAQIVKLGTMGEYGTPNLDIEEGWLDLEHNGRRDRVLYPKRPVRFP